MTTSPDVPAEILARLRSLCLALPEAYEEQAWVGTRWRIRKRTFAHVLTIDAGWPPAYARAAATDGPCTVLTFRSTAPEIAAFRDLGHPFFLTRWGRDDVGIVLGAGTDWREVEELVAESYCILAPRRLAESVERQKG